MASNGVDSDGNPLFPEEDALQAGADLEEVARYAAFRGNTLKGATAQMNDFDYPVDGLFWSNTTTDAIYRYDGTSWKLWDKAWSAYVPVLTNVSGTPTVTARYCVAVGMVRVSINFALTGANFGTGPLISLPVTARTPVGLPPVGFALYNDVSATVWVLATILLQNTTQIAPLVSQVSGSQVTTQFNVSATAPFTWTSGDSMSLEFSYEAA